VQRRGQAHGVLGEPEPVSHREPAVIVQEREQVALAATEFRAVQRVADPAFVRCRGLEPAERDPLIAGGRAHQVAAVEQAQQRRFRRRLRESTNGPTRALLMSQRALFHTLNSCATFWVWAGSL
jgi:hypothetical protein